MKRLALALVLLVAAWAHAQTFRPSGPTENGTRAVCDPPKELHIRNVGGSDGAGLCVFTSCELSSRWQSSALDGFQAWMRRRPGGGWPEKLEQELTKFCREQRRPIPDYIQHTGGDEEFLDLAVKTGRMPAVTYAGRDDFYTGRIAHMVNLAHLDTTTAAIIDNNRPGVWVWMTRRDFLQRWRDMNGGWAVVFLDPPPPPYTSEPRQMFGQCVNGQCPPGEGEWVWVHGYGWSRVLPTAPAAATPAKAEPKPEPRAEPKPEPKIENHGIDTDKVHSGKKWFLNGSECEKADAMRAVGGSGLVDDSDRWFLVCVGSEVERSKFLDLVKQLDPATRAKLHVRDYSAADWAVSQFELPRGVSVRKAARGRVGAEAGRFAGELDAGTLGKFVADCFNPPPAPMPPPPPAPPAPNPPPPANPEPAPAPTPANPSLDLPTWLLIAFAAAVAFILGTRRK